MHIYVFMGYDFVQTCILLPAFQRNILLTSSE